MESVIEEKEQLGNAVERLYEVFAQYPSKHMGGCPCCLTAGEQFILESKPLRELTESDLRSYIGIALHTFGDVKDFKHFLPRILEQMAFDPDWFQNVDLLMARMR